MGELFDPDSVFEEDYLHFASASLDDARSDEDVDVIEALAPMPAGARVLDAACGTGRLSIRLAKRGRRVTGIDRSARFLATAASQAATGGVDLHLAQGDLRHLPVLGPFELVVCWFTSFGYFDDDDNLGVLSEFRRVLAPGGTLLIETLSHDGFVRTFTEDPEAVVLDVEGDLLVDRNRFDVRHGRLECRRTLLRGGRRREAAFAIRLLTVPEWHRWLDAAGFEDVSVTNRSGESVGLSDWRLVVRARAA